MNIPNELKLGGYTIKVMRKKSMATDRNNIGEYHPRIQTIYIDEDASEQQSEETFLHELLEAIISIYDIDINHKDLSNLSVILHQVIKDNLKIFC